MSITTTIENGIIRLPEGVHVPDGTLVKIEIDKPEEFDHAAAKEKLMSLFGTWQEDPEFDRAIKDFDKIDEEMWR